MKLLLALVASATAALLVFPAGAELREFKNAQGKVIRAEIQAANETQISIKLEDGRTMTVNHDVFVEEDQEYIRDWIKSHPAPIHLRVKFTEVAEDEEEDERAGLKTVTELTRYDIEIANLDATPVSGHEVQYQVFKSKGGVFSEDANQGGFDELPEYFVLFGTELVPEIPPKSTHTVTTDLIVVNQFESSIPGAKDTEEELLGVWIRVLNLDKHVVFEAKSSDAKLKGIEWYDPSAGEAEEEKDEDSN